MSIKIMNMVWEAVDTIKDTGRLAVMLALADWSNDEGVSWPSMETLAEKSRMSARQARYTVRDLEADKLLEVTIRRGRNKTNLFKINRHSLQVLRDEKEIKPAQDEAKTGTKRPENRHGYIEGRADEPSEPSKAEPSRAEDAEKASASAPVEAGKNGKPKPDPAVHEIIRIFSETCAKSEDEGGRGFPPVVNGGKDGKLIKQALKIMPLADLRELIRLFIPSKLASDLGCSMGVMLSAHSLNLFRQGGYDMARGPKDELLRALRNARNKALPPVSDDARKLFYALCKERGANWETLHRDVLAGVNVFASVPQSADPVDFKMAAAGGES